MSFKEQQNDELSFKSFFIPFTRVKAIHYIVIIGLIVYGNGLVNPFIGDDFLQITSNSLVHSLSNIITLFFGSTFYNGTTDVGVYFKPLLSTSFALIYSIFGNTPFWFHLFQLILHIINTVIVYVVLRYFLKNTTSFFLSLIFLVHPINSQSVFYISGLQEPLFFFFGILSFWLILRFKTKYIPFTAFLLMLSLFSKEAGVLFFLLIILYFILYHKRYFLKFFIFSSFSLIIYFLLRFHAVGLIKNPHVTPINDLNLFERILNIPSILFFYIERFIYPMKLTFTNNWAYSTVTFNNFILPLIVVLVVIFIFIVTGTFIKQKSSKNYFTNYIFFTVFLVIGLSLYMQFFSLDMITSERWFYFPIVGLLGMIGTAYESLFKKINKKVLILIVLIIIFLFSIRTIKSSFDWRDSRGIYYKDLAYNQDNYIAKINIAMFLYREGRYNEAEQFVNQSINRYPRVISYNLLGLIYFEKNDYKRAKEAYSHALKLGQSRQLYESIAQLGIFYDDSNNIQIIKKGLVLYPNDVYLWKFLAILYYREGKFDEARNAIEKAYQLDPNDQVALIREALINKKGLKIDHHNVSLE